MGPIPSSSSSGAPFPVLPLDDTEWNPRLGDSGDNRLIWPEDYRISTGEWYDYTQYPSQDLVNSLSGWNQIICRFNRFSLRANFGTWGGFMEALDPGHPDFYPVDLPSGLMKDEDFSIRHGFSLLKSRIDSIYINYYGYPAYPWTYGGYDDTEKEDYRILGVDIMEIRKAIDYAVAGYAEVGIGWSQEIRSYRHTAIPYSPPPYPPIPPATLFSALFTCGPPVLPMDGSTTISACRENYSNSMVHGMHRLEIAYPTYHMLGLSSYYQLLERLPWLTILPPASELTESLMRYTIRPWVNLPAFAGPRSYVVHQKGEDDDKTCESYPSAPACPDSIFLSPEVYLGEFTIDFSVGPWPRSIDVPIAYSIVDPKATGHKRPIIGLSDKNVFNRTVPPTSPVVLGSFYPAILVYFGQLILKGF